MKTEGRGLDCLLIVEFPGKKSTETLSGTADNDVGSQATDYNCGLSYFFSNCLLSNLCAVGRCLRYGCVQVIHVESLNSTTCLQECQILEREEEESL